jgi:hypothetical protein
VLRLVQEERAVKPQVLSHTADLAPIALGRRQWLAGWRQPYSGDQLGDGRRIERRQLEPTARMRGH